MNINKNKLIRAIDVDTPVLLNLVIDNKHIEIATVLTKQPDSWLGLNEGALTLTCAIGELKINVTKIVSVKIKDDSIIMYVATTTPTTT